MKRTYAEAMRDAANIDEKGKSLAWIERYGRDAMIQKTDDWYRRSAEYEALPESVKNSGDADICSCGKVGCDCGVI